jgi:hypothetical protein
MEPQVQAAILDLDDSLEAFDPAADETTIRRSLKTILTNLNQLREYRIRKLGIEYFDIQGRSDFGATTAALIMVRGFSEHNLVRAIVPEQRLLYPGEDMFPSEHLYAGANLVWVPLPELPFTLVHKNPKFNQEAAYTCHLAKRPIAATFAVARKFLVEDTWLGPI